MTSLFASFWDRLADRTLIDGTVDLLARWTYATGLSLRRIQTGRLRQYVLFIVLFAIVIFVVVSFFWDPGAVQAR